MALALVQQVHPDLRLEKLARLPPDLRRIAKTAASGSLESLTRLERPVKEGPESHKLLFLPVFYANLDPDGIPSPDEVDTTEPSISVVSALMRAYVSLQALESYPDLSLDLYPVLWPRVWTWIDFLDNYYFCLDAAAGSRDANRAHFLQYIQRFRSHETAVQLVDSTHGVWTMVGRMWALCVERNLFARGFAGATVVGRFIAGPVSTLHLAELVEALGVTQSDLALVIVKHLNLLTCDPRNPLAPSNLYHLKCVLVFLTKAHRNGLLARAAFMSEGLAKALVETTCSLNRVGGTDAAEMMRGTWDLLRWVATENVLHIWMPGTLKSGLLRAIVACATHNPPAIDMPDFRQVLTRDLPSSLVYYSVLKRVAKAFRDVKTADMRGTAISDEWTAFMDLANARLAVFRFFESDEYVLKRACDNTKCAIIDARKRLGVCSVCRRRYYCSVDCQRIDWIEGAHKIACDVLYTRRVNHAAELSRRDTHFLGALLHHDYRAARPTILLQQLEFMTEHPGAPFYTHFDYSRGAVVVTVLPLADDHHPGDATHPFRVAQAAASRGRMELHYMFVSAGSTGRGRWFPMRSSNATLSEGLETIARGIGIEPGGSVEAIRERLLEDVHKLEDEIGTDLEQIH